MCAQELDNLTLRFQCRRAIVSTLVCAWSDARVSSALLTMHPSSLPAETMMLEEVAVE